MNFPPTQDFSRAADLSGWDSVTPQKIDAIVYRDPEHTPADSMINAVARHVAVRLITEPTEYRNPTRLWDAKHIDRMYMGGVQIKMRQHEGMTHEALVINYGLGEVIFGLGELDDGVRGVQDEHNYFYTPSLNKPWFLPVCSSNQFEGKWNDTVLLRAVPAAAA
jgi:hypothetical protein